MKQSISLITLGVADIERSRAFYESLGWSPAREIEETLFFQANGVVLVVWGREKLADDMGIEDADPGWGGIALAHNVDSRDQVDAITEAARNAGAVITREPAETFYGGYAAGFRDPDGHVWEIAHNPGFPLLPDGSVVVDQDGETPSA
jgi:catechol 2,3-dioxygenase-like lactoylglutathione lyase family enzyme